MKNMPKKNLIIAAAVIVILLILGGGVWFVKARGAKPTQQQTATNTKKRIELPVNVIPIEERPVVYIAPKPDGKNIEIVVDAVKKAATKSSYEIEYFTENLVQGAEGALDISSLPSRTTLLLGSCSAGGACSYHKNVTGGSLKTEFDGSESYALKNDWRYFENKDKEDNISSKDTKFQITSADLKKVGYVVITNSPGYPEGLKGTPQSDPFAFAPATTMTGKADVSIHANAEGNLSIMGWDGKAWHEFTGKVDGKTITATADIMQLYIAVSK